MARRARFDTQYWAQHVSKQQASGLTVREYCECENIQVHHFYYGRKRLASAPAWAARPVTPLVARSASSQSTTQSTSSQHDDSQSVVIQLGAHAAVRIPAQLHSTIEAVLKMVHRVSVSESSPVASGFHSVVVRS
jgi:hypothetical protein